MHKIGRGVSSLASAASRESRRSVWGASRAALPRSARRALHIRRELRYPLENGVADFLPPAALKTSVEWQDGLLDRLNDQVRGTDCENKSVLQTIIDTAADRQRVMTFNYASLAANNSFFLDSILPPEEGRSSNENEISPNLKSAIINYFKDMETLQERMLAAASGMASSGWLWLVTDGKDLAVVPTFGPGTLLVRSHQIIEGTQQEILARQIVAEKPDTPGAEAEASGAGEGEFASATASIPGTSTSGSFSSHAGPPPTSPFSGARTPPSSIDPHTPSRSFSLSLGRSADYESIRNRDGSFVGNYESMQASKMNRGQRLFPIFCLSLYEHTWMSAGLGVWGKEEYVRRFFKVVDWKKASEVYAKFYSMKPVSRF